MRRGSYRYRGKGKIGEDRKRKAGPTKYEFARELIKIKEDKDGGKAYFITGLPRATDLGQLEADFRILKYDI